MGAQPREVKVVAALSASMTIGFLVLMALGNNPPSAGAFCLSSYYRLEPVNNVISHPADSNIQLKPWKRIKVSYINIPSVQNKLSDKNRWKQPENINKPLTGSQSESQQIRGHFFICDGIVGNNGQIIPTHKWQQQQQISSEDDSTIVISVITGGYSNGPTGIQIERTGELVVAISKKFNIPTEYILY